MPKTKDPLFKSLNSKSKTPTGTCPSLPADVTTFKKTIVDRIEMVSVNSLKAHPRRTRTHDERQIVTIMGAFNEFGFLNPLIIDEDNVVLAGDARVEAARRLGIATLPAVRVEHLNEAEKRAYKIADNRIAELAGWDLPELSIELNELIEIDFNMDAIGFDAPMIDLVMSEAATEAANEPDPADTLPDAQPGPATSRLGDVWQLGLHRVVCGSALDPQVLQTLMGGRKARMIMTDVPFNVAIGGFVGGLGKVKHREFAMASGEMTKAEFLEFLTQASTIAASHLVDGGLFDGFMDWRSLGAYMNALEAAGLTQINLCVWNKGTGGMGSFYRSQHELCVVYKKGTAAHINNVELGRHGRYRTNVWDHPGMASFGRGRNEELKLHPTVKPVNLLAEAIKDATHHNDIVLDTFLGSGSTLIAAQKCKRVCYGVEIDPLYVDTIVRRFEAYAGIEAIHADTGKTFAEMAAIRAQQAAELAADTATASLATASPAAATDAETLTPLETVRVRTRQRPGAEPTLPSDTLPNDQQETLHA
ncbi:site-specific DNA-methyltransferase [Rhizobium sp. Root482]|uniref:site-specific DNA-methyltransferase n=1 Tax=Rhizobium sp. Root482 TaxID=1736543 RepID=UPI000AE46E30|nr:DNA methyltransferase [Rhizobium sp. Root482]